jgi:hypothetical protein
MPAVVFDVHYSQLLLTHTTLASTAGVCTFSFAAMPAVVSDMHYSELLLACTTMIAAAHCCAFSFAAMPAVVFDMHYSELLLKGEEIERLKSVIEGMGGSS